MIKNYEQLTKRFTPPSQTPAGIPFGNPPESVTFPKANIVVYGVRFDDTATFGKGSDRGPEAIRHTSARQVETFVIDEYMDIYQQRQILDLGDLNLKHTLTEKERKALYAGNSQEKKKATRKLEKIVEELGVLEEITTFISSQRKIPVMLGGEHTLSYWPLSALVSKEPVILHFDAHRDAKAEYQGVKLCHTTPMYHAIAKGCKGEDFIQIGIRQADQDEQDFATDSGITTFYPRDIEKNIKAVREKIKAKTKGRNVYVTFDIDALDIQYTPCTGTPEPFGMNPQQVVYLLKSVSSDAKLVGADLVEVAVRGNDFREGTLATQILLRLFAREYVGRNNNP